MVGRVGSSWGTWDVGCGAWEPNKPTTRGRNEAPHATWPRPVLTRAGFLTPMIESVPVGTFYYIVPRVRAQRHGERISIHLAGLMVNATSEATRE